MHKYTTATQSEILGMLGMGDRKDPSAAEIDNALHSMNLMRLDACFPIGNQTVLITIQPERIEDYRLVLPLLAVRRAMHRIATVGEFDLPAIKVNDLAGIDRELIRLQEEYIETMSVFPLYKVYTFERANLIAAVRKNLPDKNEVSQLAMWTAEYLTGINAIDLMPPGATATGKITESIASLISQGINATDAMLVYWLDCNPESNMEDIESLGQYLGVENAKERVTQILSQYA